MSYCFFDFDIFLRFSMLRKLLTDCLESLPPQPQLPRQKALNRKNNVIQRNMTVLWAMIAQGKLKTSPPFRDDAAAKIAGESP